ncbi:LysR substrate-binding domain-containing protein [Microbacterium aoyamense]|uniref:LysR substrate-binding domain-containing protein n=1 Tax=Microbacterium aoyamense TaxID=344166 RepID=A0ABP5B4B8_9MICO|nr:substrate-binding domain-containing protein [Microbacterium aoyamense]
MAKRTAPRGGKRPASRAPQKKPASAPTPPVGPLRLGAVPGATPGKWIDTWQERHRDSPLELVPIAAADQRRALVDGEVDAAIIRLPIQAEGLSVIPLYDELPVVVMSTDSHLTAAEDLELEDLAGEVLITALDDVLGVEVPESVVPRFAAPPTTGDAIETVATGVGIVIVPMSLARAHHRKDVEFRVLRDWRSSSVGLAWPTASTTPAIEAFIGIVRGRTANSSRG